MSAHTSTKNCISIAKKYDRVILLVDMDCFYCQVEEKLNPSLKGKPLAVVQYNAWRGGGIIAVNYPARAKGVTRHMRGDEAKKQCPDIELVKVPSVREKADLTKYREAGKEVANVLQRFTPLLERASVDEAYLDITDAVNKRVQLMNKGSFELQPKQLFNTYAVGYSGIGEFLTTITTMYQTPSSSTACAPIYQSNLRLLAGASIATEIRASVKTDTGYECSAGIAHNKILAKLACGINKPNKQTILTLDQIPTLFATLPLNKIKGLGGKFGEDIANLLNVRYVGDLLNFTEQDLQSKFDEKNGTWLYNICRGIDLEAVTPRFYSKSIGCCKKFPGRNNITGIKTLQHWLNELANEINERLEKDLMENNRRAKQMVVSFVQDFNGEETSSSRSAPLNTYETETLAKNALDLIKNNTKQFLRAGSDGILNNPIKFLGISVGKFETVSAVKTTLQEMFANQATAAAAAALSNKENENLENAESVKENETCSTACSEAPVKPSNDMNSFLLPRIEKKDVKKPDEFLVTNKRDEKPMNRTESYFISMLQKPDEKNPENTKLPERNKNELNPLMYNRQSPSEACGNDNTFNNPTDTTSTTNTIQNTAIQENSDYRLHYAEYAIPTFQEDLLNFITCPECNKKIPNDAKALQMHQDQHYAHQLSQQQRFEYREEIKAKSLNTTKFPQSNTSTAGLKRKAKKSPPTNVTKVKKPLLGDIKKFLKPETTLINIEIAATSDNSIKCDKCKEMIEKKNMQEHQDYHMAKELQKEINQHPVQKLNVKETAPSKATRLQPLTSVLSTSKPKVISKPITQFFAKP